MRCVKNLIAIMLFPCLLTPSAVAQGPSKTVDFSPCHLQGIEALAECGVLEVPEDWAEPSSKTLQIHIARIPPSGGQPLRPPLFVIAGGPGEAASSYGPIVSILQRARADREVILVDQRGSGKSTPFSCSWDNLSRNVSAEDLVARCWVDKHRATEHYTTRHFVRDLEAVRQALNVPEIDIWAGSYGTRVALNYARDFEAHVGSMVLDSVVPPSIKILEKDTQTFSSALNQVFLDCASDIDCSQAFPNLESSFGDLISGLKGAPPSFGSPVRPINAKVFADGLQPFLYNTEFAAAIPFVIDQARQGNFRPWSSLSSDDLYGALSPSLTLSVHCSEEFSRTNPANILKGTVFSSSYFTVFETACRDWNSGQRYRDYEAPVQVDTRTLLLVGALDPVTPPDFAFEAAKTLPNSQVIVAGGLGHAISTHGCAPDIIAEFLNAADKTPIDGRCLEESRRPPFILSASGPKP